MRSIFSKTVFWVLLLLLTISFFSCEEVETSDDTEAGEVSTEAEDSDDESTTEETEEAETFPESKTCVVSPATSPYGVGIDFESGTIYTLTSDSDTFAYDVKMKTIKGLTDEGNKKGAPYIKLYKQLATAYKYSLTGKTNFVAIKTASVDTTLFKSDSVDEIADSEVTNTSGKYVYNSLISYYQANFVTKDSSNWLPSEWTVGEDEAIFIIKTTDSHMYKFTILGMGTTSGSKPGSGTLEFAYAIIN